MNLLQYREWRQNYLRQNPEASQNLSRKAHLRVEENQPDWGQTMTIFQPVPRPQDKTRIRTGEPLIISTITAETPPKSPWRDMSSNEMAQSIFLGIIFGGIPSLILLYLGGIF